MSSDPQSPEKTVNSEMIKLKSIELSISVLIIIVNAVEICLLKRRRNKKNVEIVLLSLSVADLLYGILNGSFQLIQIFEVTKTSWTSFHVIFNVRLFFMLASIFHLLLIGADRLFEVANPFEHNVVVTKRRLYWALFLVWVLSFSGLGLFQIYDEYLSTKEEAVPESMTKKPPRKKHLEIIEDSMVPRKNSSAAENSTHLLT